MDDRTCEVFAAYLIQQATREASKVHPVLGTESEYRRSCRLQQEIWALRRAVQEACRVPAADVRADWLPCWFAGLDQAAKEAP